MATSDLKFIEPNDVVELITGENKDRVLVVDVRDEVRFSLGIRTSHYDRLRRNHRISKQGT